MKAVILAGGLGTRISEETSLKPKPMVEIGGKPILWHIMKLYSFYGIKDFIICCGYKGYIIKEYFFNYCLHNSDFSVNTHNNEIKIHSSHLDNWNVTMVDTGSDTMTGGRLLRVSKFLKDQKNFLMTYGDGVSNINIKKLINFHNLHKKKATMSVVQPIGKFGSVIFDKKNNIKVFKEKPKQGGSWINAGFFVLNRDIFKHLKNDKDIWEKVGLEKLSQENQLKSFQHTGFWKCMDTLKDKNDLEQIWNSKKCPWRLWKKNGQ